jgi:serine/threonine protein kinase
MSDWIAMGTVIAGRYRVEAQLGKGGMGEVFAAENVRTGRKVALKVLRSEAKDKEVAVERFRREARAAGAIRSEFVTEVYDVEEDPEFGIVLVFELLEGESLVERLKRTGPIPMLELWTIVEAVWVGLADAHAAGIIHRDLKPSNVFLVTRPEGLRVKLLDFGISKLPKEISADSLTQVGQSLGTFSFMPPEQIGRAKSVDHRADIYACTTLVYQALSGKLPFSAKNAVVMMELKMREAPMTLAASMSTPVEPALEAFIARGLARNPDARFQTALEALEAWRALRPSGSVSLVKGAPSASVVRQEPEEDSQTIALQPRRSMPDRTLHMAAVPAPHSFGSGLPSGPSDEASTVPHSLLPRHAPPLAHPPIAPHPGLPWTADDGHSGAHGPIIGARDSTFSPTTDGGAPRPPAAPSGSSWKLVLGAIGLVVVGFGLAALALKLLR